MMILAVLVMILVILVTDLGHFGPPGDDFCCSSDDFCHSGD